MEYRVYLSSTLKDLELERRAVQEALADLCVVKHSYSASEQDLVESCLSDVEQCHLYVLILGLRYGYVPGKPFKNPKKLSITELEYRHAGARKIPRLVLLKDENVIPVTSTDLKTREHSPDRIEKLRELAGKEQRPAVFKDIPGLRERVVKDFNALRNRRKKGSTRKASPTHVSRQASHDDVRTGYVEWLRSECEKIVLLGLGARERQNVRLGQVYVPALTAIELKDLPAQEAGRRERGPQHEPLLHRLGRKSLYVPGSPGSGKSTFCRWAALVAATGNVASRGLPHEFEEEMPNGLRGRFPFLCQLRQWASDERWLAGNGHWTRVQLERSLAAWIGETKLGGLTSRAFLEAIEGSDGLFIFDGVDEVPEKLGTHYPRQSFLSGLADALPVWTARGHRVVLTSRPYGVDDADRNRLGLPQADLSPLPRALQDVFVHRWYAAADAPDSDAKAGGLIAHLDERQDLQELRANPMLLTALCVKYDEDLRLPGDLYRLYDSVIDRVLYKRYETESERDLARLRLGAVALAMHQGLPGHPRTTPEAEVSLDDVDETLIELTRTDKASEQAGAEASERREHLLSNSGLLLPRPNKRAAFYHLSFQEFLSAVRLRRVSDDVKKVLTDWKRAPEWRRTLRFLFCAVADQKSPEQALEAVSVLLDDLEPDRLKIDSNPALLLADCLEVGHARRWNLHAFSTTYRQACQNALTHVAPPARAHLWRILGRLGLDDRPGVGVRGGVPDVEWIEIPEGPFEFGEGRQAVTLPAFRIARYPITNAQFDAFVADSGFEEKKWWRWPKYRKPPLKSRFPYPNHPRETVSWFDASAFCTWLTSRLHERGELDDRQTIRLPNEEEWEKAARGPDGRNYPWGWAFESGRANIDETGTLWQHLADSRFGSTAESYRPTVHKLWGEAGPLYLRQTSAVGIYPVGSSPYHIDDLAGNVWEWCEGPYKSKPESLSASRAMRGGSWQFNRLSACCWNRDGYGSEARAPMVGFRVVCVSSNQ